MVVLEDATDFTWDAVGVLHPYYRHESVVEDMGVRAPRAVTNNTQWDHHGLLVFRRGDRMVQWSTVHRAVAECWPGESTGVHTPAEARFAADAFRPIAPVAD